MVMGMSAKGMVVIDWIDGGLVRQVVGRSG